jgi:hypothetical protein
MVSELTPAGKPAAPMDWGNQDGNAYAIMGAVARGLRKTGHTKEEIETYHEDSTSGDYDHLLQTAMRWSTDYE